MVARRKRRVPKKRNKCFRLSPGCRCANCQKWRAQREERQARGPLGGNIFEAITLDGDDEFFEVDEMPAPCDHMPGSPEKLAELSRRLEAGQSLWHEDDREFWDTED